MAMILDVVLVSYVLKKILSKAEYIICMSKTDMTLVAMNQQGNVKKKIIDIIYFLWLSLSESM